MCFAKGRIKYEPVTLDDDTNRHFTVPSKKLKVH